MTTRSTTVSWVARGQRRLNGPQTTGREHRKLSEPDRAIEAARRRPIIVRDGAAARRRAPPGRRAVPSARRLSPFPRQLQNSAPRSASSRPVRATSGCRAATRT